MRTIDKIITKVDGSRGAPMGRHNVGKHPHLGTVSKEQANKKVFNCAVPMNGAYDRGGVYWGLSSSGKGMGQLRVEYTKDLTYINFYRK